MTFKRAVVAVFLLTAFLVSSLLAGTGTGRPRFSFSFGGLVAMSKLGYTYIYYEEYYGETATLEDALAKKNGSGFLVDAGFFLTRTLEVFGGVSSAKGSGHRGSIAVSVPNMYYYGDFSNASALQERNVSHFDVLFGLKWHPLPDSRVSPYAGFGGCFASSTAQIFSDAIINDDYGPFGDHYASISQIEFEDVKARTAGAFMAGGVDIRVGRSLAFFAEGLVKFAKKAVVHPYSVEMGLPRNVSLDLGGTILSMGVRLFL